MSARVRGLRDGLAYLSVVELAELTVQELGELEIEPRATAVFRVGPRRDNPTQEYNPQQAIVESAGGTRYVYDKGPGADIRSLAFDEMDATNKELLETFVKDTAIGASERFSYDDHNRRTWRVEFESGLLQMRAADKRRATGVYEDVWSVNFDLRIIEEMT